MKKITIITPSYNRAGMIETAIQSVLDQSYPPVEHIIIDGGSMDGTLNVMKKYPNLQVVSEPDQGMYDALNKGISRASGDLIGVLNSDDRYPPEVFKEAVKIFSTHPEVDVVWGSADVFEMTANGEKRLVTLRPPKDENEIIRFLTFEVPIFNACFFRKQVFDRWGQFIPDLKIAGDREFMLRTSLGGCKFYMTDTVFYHYIAHGDSITFGNKSHSFEQWNKEHCQFAEYYLGQPNTSTKARAAYQQIHTISNLSLIKIALKKHKIARAVGLALHGWRVNPGWLLLFIKRCLKNLRNLLRREKKDD